MKKIIATLAITVMASLFLACGSVPSAPYVKGGHIQRSISYFKDERTKMCFAQTGYYESYSFTTVPCSEEVENLIGK